MNSGKMFNFEAPPFPRQIPVYAPEADAQTNLEFAVKSVKSEMIPVLNAVSIDEILFFWLMTTFGGDF